MEHSVLHAHSLNIIYYEPPGTKQTSNINPLSASVSASNYVVKLTVVRKFYTIPLIH